MTVLKMLHVLFLFVWIGSLLSLTRFLGYLPQEESLVQTRLAKLCKRIYLFVELPSLILAVVLGLILLIPLKFGPSAGWFHMKMTFAVALVICDIICGRFVFKADAGLIPQKAIKYKILHGVTALMLIGALSSIYLVRNKTAEVKLLLLEELQDQHAQSSGGNIQQ